VYTIGIDTKCAKKNQLEEQESFFASILPEDNKQKKWF